MRWVDWAFRARVATAEKLVLVYLATRANYAGVGLMDRNELQSLTGYEKRSVQRLLKSLRDSKHLTDGGPWYVLTTVPGETSAAWPDPAAELAPATIDALPPPMDGQESGPLSGPLMRSGGVLSEEEIDKAGETIGNHVKDGAEYLMDQLHNFEARLAGLFVRGAQQLEVVLASAQRHDIQPVPVPPPDPVRESDLFKSLITLLPPEVAYATAKAQLESIAAKDAKVEDTEELLLAEVARRKGKSITPVFVGLESKRVQAYSDDPAGRCTRVWDILHSRLPDQAEFAELMRTWLKLEEDENKFNVKGESTTAFESLYPAIVAAARERAGNLSIWEFLEPKAIEQGRAPWDQDPTPAAVEDVVLQAEVNQMLAELAATHHPGCQVGPRTVEKREGGGTYSETIVGYHRRVKGKYAEMKKLKAMGVI